MSGLSNRLAAQSRQSEYSRSWHDVLGYSDSESEVDRAVHSWPGFNPLAVDPDIFPDDQNYSSSMASSGNVAEMSSKPIAEKPPPSDSPPRGNRERYHTVEKQQEEEEEEVVSGLDQNLDDHFSKLERPQTEFSSSESLHVPLKPSSSAHALTLCDYFIHSEAKFQTNLAKLCELGARYKNAASELDDSRDSMIMFPPVLVELLKNTCDLTHTLKSCFDEQEGDPVNLFLHALTKRLPQLQQAYTTFALHFYSARDAALKHLTKQGVFSNLYRESQQSWSEHEFDFGLSFFELLYQPLQRPFKQCEYFENLFRELNDAQEESQSLVCKIIPAYKQLQLELCNLLHVHCIEEVDFGKVEHSTPGGPGSSLLTRFSTTSRERNGRDAVTSILPPHMPEPRIRSNSDWDVLQGSFSIKKGRFTKLSRRGKSCEYMFWLFNDALLYGFQEKYHWLSRKCMPINDGFAVKDLPESELSNAFEIHTSKKSFRAFTRTPQEKKEWLEAFNNVIWEYRTDPRSHHPKPKRVKRVRCHSSPECEMEQCSTTFSPLGSLFKRHTCGFCGNQVCSNCFAFSLPLIRSEEDKRACARCYYKVLKYERKSNHRMLCPPGSYLVLIDQLPVRRDNNVDSDLFVGKLEHGSIVHITECHRACARIDHPYDGYIPLRFSKPNSRSVFCLVKWDMKHWSHEEVLMFFQTQGLEQYLPTIQKLKLTGNDMYDIKESELTLDLKIETGILRRRLLRNLHIFKKNYLLLRRNNEEGDSDHEEGDSGHSDFTDPPHLAVEGLATRESPVMFLNKIPDSDNESSC